MSQEQKACPSCGQQISAASIVCVHCGRDMQGRLRRPGAQAIDAPQTQRPVNWRPLLIALALVAVAFGAYKAYQYRQEAAEREETRKGLVAADAFVRRWADALELAGSTSRIALAGPISTLQSLRREAADIPFPPCLTDGKAAIALHMDQSIEGFMLFMRNQPDPDELRTLAKLERAKKQMDRYLAARQACELAAAK